MDERGVTGGFEWDAAEDLTALCGVELVERLEDLVREERALSYRRRVLHGRIDLIRADLLCRGCAVLSPERLARVLVEHHLEREAGGPRL
jgi:hypothetical protein